MRVQPASERHAPNPGNLAAAAVPLATLHKTDSGDARARRFTA